MLSKIDKYRYANLPLESINSAFVKACSNGDLELVKYFLFDKKIINAQLEYQNYTGVSAACHGRHNELMKFFFEGKELTKHVSLHFGKGNWLFIAVTTNNIELMEYLLKNGNKQKMNLNQNDDQIIISLMGTFYKNEEMIKKLIVEYNIDRTQRIIDFLDEKNMNVGQKKLVNEWFEKREFMQTLQYVFTEDVKETEVKPKKKNKI